MIRVDRGVLKLLRDQKPSPLHVIDPFKVSKREAVEKAVAVERQGLPALILGSTDYNLFADHMPDYVAAIKAAVEIPVLLHFPPRYGTGFPVVLGADAVIFPALLASQLDYFVWKSYLETLTTLSSRGAEPSIWPEFLLSAALTFGRDQVSYEAMATVPIKERRECVRPYIDIIRLLGFDMVYLYSRYEAVSLELCRFFRQHLRPEQLIFVSGGVRTNKQVADYIDAGADYVGFAGALERPEWREALDQICSVNRS